MLLNLSLRPVLPPDYSFFASNLTIARIRLTLIRPPADTVAVVTQALSPDSSAVKFVITAALRASSESLLAVVDYQTSQGVTLFSGQVDIVATTGTPSSSTPSVPLTYSGPGLNIASISIAPLNDTLNAGDSTLYQIAAIDSSQQPVTSFYVSWSTTDTRVPINAVGLVRAPNITKNITITALTPNGTFAQTNLTILGSGLGILPDSVEMLPGGRQAFSVDIGPGGPYTWSVHGVDGGNTTFGTVDPQGLYIAPTVVPNPGTFKVCARVTAAPTQQGCATVVLSAVPSAGTDVIVINDMNLFDANFMAQDINNRRFAANMVTFVTTGSRNAGRVVMYDRGRNSSCFGDGECADGPNVTIDSVLHKNGFSIVKVDTVASWANIPPNVKVIFLWNPTIAYTTADINGFKLFASQGGRIVFLGEHIGFYAQVGIDTENQFLSDMGSQFTNVGAVLACTETIPKSQIQAHQTTTGLTDIVIACASEAQPGPNDFPLIFESTGLAVAGVAKISVVPLPAPAATSSQAGGSSVRRPHPVVNGVNHRQ
ncbi:MAG: hypothetical protein ABI836_05250 [Gemmatimonadota bacterium]